MVNFASYRKINLREVGKKAKPELKIQLGAAPVAGIG